MALAVVGGQDGPELAITGEVEAIIGSIHQQAGHIAPADQVLQVAWRPVPEWGWKDDASTALAKARQVSCQPQYRAGGMEEVGYRRSGSGGWGKMLSCTPPKSNLPRC